VTSRDLRAPPWEWQTDQAGRPVAMTDWPGRWAPVRAPFEEQPRARDGRRAFMSARAPRQMPCLPAREAPHGKEKGASRLTDRRPALTQQTAWLVDLAGQSNVARTYGPSRHDLRARIAALDEQIRTGPQRTQTATARADEKRRLENQLHAEKRLDNAASTRELKAMRLAHWERGTLPWALWSRGELPDEWWLTDKWTLWTAIWPTLAASRRAFSQAGALSRLLRPPSGAATHEGVLTQLDVLLVDEAGNPPGIDRLREHLSPCEARELFEYLVADETDPAAATPAGRREFNADACASWLERLDVPIGGRVYHPRRMTNLVCQRVMAAPRIAGGRTAA